MAKYLVITGGVLSGLGKGVITASTGLLLKSLGYSVTAIKIDPYVNVDAGTMNPYIHGEVFVTDDGGETDLDIGHYERFLNASLSKKNNITTGQIFMRVIEKERMGAYLGQCVQIIPHITDEVKNRINEVARETGVDIVLVEIGGTVGDIEGLPFLEAVRQLRMEEGADNVAFIHVALAPILSTTGELKTKPVQHSVQELRRIGIQPDAVIVRSIAWLDNEARRKIALYSNLPPLAVFSVPDLDTIYRVPLVLNEQGFTKYIAERMKLKYIDLDLEEWCNYTKRLISANREASIAMVGKYTKLHDSYISIIEALNHSGALIGVKPKLKWIEATEIEEGVIKPEVILESNGVIVLPGFGRRGAEGKIKAIEIARENKKPLLGICFGFQLMVVEYARNVIGLSKANSTEVDPHTPHPVVDLLPEQRAVSRLGGTMRLGLHPIKITAGTLAYEIYGKEIVYERHRHRYEVNAKYIDLLESGGLTISGWSIDGFPEIVELKDSSFYLGIQAHPEFRSRPLNPSPIYVKFLERAALSTRQ